MKTAPIQAATLSFNEQGVPWSEAFGDVYHPQAGAFAQAQHVFLAGNGLPDRWSEGAHKRFVILETGFGLGNNFLATWQALDTTPGPRPVLDFISIERSPFTRADLQRAHAHSPCPELASALLEQWPPLTHNLHSLRFDNAQVRLLLAFGDALAWLPELVASVDAFYLDGFAPARNPELWQERVFKTLARLAKPGATVATWSAARTVRDGLTSAGFEVRATPGTGGKRDITLARFAPRFTPRPPSRCATAVTGTDQRALIIGAGLAGCATARGLANVGWHSRVLDSAAQPASGASGNPAGLFHGIVNGQDGAHSRLYRAAALSAHNAIRQAIDHHGVHGHAQGLLRLETRRSEAEMQALLHTLGLPSDYVQALSPQAATAASGLPLSCPAWLFPGGGWVDPAGLCQAYLAQAGERVQFQGQSPVASISHEAGLWTAWDAQGGVLGSAPALVLANAGDAQRLLGWHSAGLKPVRGQLSWCEDDALAALGLGWPTEGQVLPVAGTGYCLRLPNGQGLFGATSQEGDIEPLVREADHALNVMQLARLLGQPLQDIEATDRARQAALHGRVGWRWATADKLPLWGGVPAPGAGQHERVRQVERVPGLFVCTGLGSRGITWSALAGEVVAALISGAPCPLESSLLDAVDPARF